VENFDSGLALALYLSNFNNPSEWRFVFSGNINPTTLKKLVVKYLGSIPINERFIEGITPSEEDNDTSTSTSTSASSTTSTTTSSYPYRISDLKLSVPSSEYITPMEIPSITRNTYKRLKLKMQDPVSRMELCWPIKLAAGGDSNGTDVDLAAAHVNRLEVNWMESCIYLIKYIYMLCDSFCCKYVFGAQLYLAFISHHLSMSTFLTTFTTLI
jgi:hypothetical protein